MYPALSSQAELLPELCLWSLPVCRPGCSMAQLYSLLWEHFEIITPLFSERQDL